jgi:glycine dehydrogenase subunit 1
MMEAMGISSTEELFADIPETTRFRRALDLPRGMSELELQRHLTELAERNVTAGEYTCFLGAGAYDHFSPTLIHDLIMRGEFYTAYTPYQAEISQGTLEAIYEFQTMICELTNMDVANASMYDGSTAVAEAALMALASSRGRRQKAIVASSVHPEYREVLETYAHPVGLDIVEVPFGEEGTVDLEALEAALDDDTSSVIIQNPNFFGLLENGEAVGKLLEDSKAQFVVVCDPISLGLLEAPDTYGADIVVGEGQPMGNALSFGGPYVGFFAAREGLMRRMPGRIVGATVDHDGNRGFVLTMQTREQHIRRERATSNICTNEALNALAATIYMAYMGPKGLRDVARQSMLKAHYLFDGIADIDGFEPMFDAPFFKEFAFRSETPADEVLKKLEEKRILGGVSLGRFYPELDDAILSCVTEKRTRKEIDSFTAALEMMA